MKLLRRFRRDQGRPRLAVLGAMRSGTNVVRAMLQAHWDVEVDDAAYGWKHGGVPVLSPDSTVKYPGVPIVYVVKNPFAFVDSLYRYSCLAHEQGRKISLRGEAGLDDFLHAPVVVFDSQLPGSPQVRHANPVQYWNSFYWNLETLDRDRFTAIGFNYEDILAEPARLAEVERITDAPRIRERIELPEQKLRRHAGRGTPKTGTRAFDASYYSERRYLAQFSEAQLDFIRSQADPELMRARGYDGEWGKSR